METHEPANQEIPELVVLSTLDETSVLEEEKGSGAMETYPSPESQEQQGQRQTAIGARDGSSHVDLQGIDWSNINISPHTFRQSRLRTYHPMTSLDTPAPLTDILKIATPFTGHAKMFQWSQSYLQLKPQFYHTQLRGVIQTDKHHLYYCRDGAVWRFNCITKELHRVFRFGDPQSPVNAGLIVSFCVAYGLIFIGGMRGEFAAVRVSDGHILTLSRLTAAENSIVNGVTAHMSRNGGRRIACANNDCFVKVFDIPMLKEVQTFQTEWAVNHCSSSADGRLHCFTGDDTSCLVVDSISGRHCYELKGHVDYAFCSSFHPQGVLLATSNQDQTVRIWDLRNTSQSLHVLKSRMAAMRTLSFSRSGQLLTVAEDADFVHIFDVGSGFRRAQTLEYFGEITGFAMTPEEDELFVGVTDFVFGCIAAFRNRSKADDILRIPL